MEKADKYIIEPFKRSIKKLSSEKLLDKLEIQNSGLNEDAVAIGAAALIIREIFMGG